jgi:hypothetical protein
VQTIQDFFNNSKKTKSIINVKKELTEVQEHPSTSEQQKIDTSDTSDFEKNIIEENVKIEVQSNEVICENYLIKSDQNNLVKFEEIDTSDRNTEQNIDVNINNDLEIEDETLNEETYYDSIQKMENNVINFHQEDNSNNCLQNQSSMTSKDTSILKIEQSKKPSFKSNSNLDNIDINKESVTLSKNEMENSMNNLLDEDNTVPYLQNKNPATSVEIEKGESSKITMDYTKNYAEFHTPELAELLTLETCSEPGCSKQIPSFKMIEHLDQHLAHQLSQQLREEYRNELKIVKKPPNVKNEVSRKSSKNCSKSISKIPSVAKFLSQKDSSTNASELSNFVNCDQCSSQIHPDKYNEHLDYHFAQRLRMEECKNVSMNSIKTEKTKSSTSKKRQPADNPSNGAKHFKSFFQK